ARAAQALALGSQRVDDDVHDVVRHVHVDFAGQLDEARLEVVFTGLPGQVERIDGDAVAAQAGPGIERHEAVGLGRRQLDDLPDVDVHATSQQRHLIDQRDVHATEDVLEQLDHLGYSR